MRQRRASHHRRRWPWLLLALLALALAPAAVTETACRRSPEKPRADTSGRLPIADQGYARPETNSYLSYPEWYLVYAYQDYAAVLDRADADAFDYTGSIADYWTSLCGVNRIAAARGGSDPVEKAMLYIIGDSFTVEMALKGAYENTVGRLTAWLRGPVPTPEDDFARAVADDYAAFLQQTPWYEYPFASSVRRFWTEVPFGAASPIRAVERRIGLSLEWGVKSGYARLIALAAGLAPADLRIQSVVRGIDPAALAALPGTAVIRTLPDGLTLIDTPRYGAFTTLIADLAARGAAFVEVAGNRLILVTTLLPPGDEGLPTIGAPVFGGPVQSRPGWRRVGLDVPVSGLTALVSELQAEGAEFEHAYDY